MAFFIIFAVLVFGAFGLAWWRGGAPERVVATLYAAAWLITLVVDPADGARWWSIEVQFVVIDIVLLIALVLVALRANRYWPMWAASLQIMILLAHVAKGLNPNLFRFVYMVMTTSWPVFQLLLLIVGTLAVWRRRSRGQDVSSWSR